MSQTADTVANVLQIIADLRGETSTNTDSARIRAVSRAEQDFSLRRFWRSHLLVDQTATGDGTTSSFTIGTTTYPMRFKGLVELFAGGTRTDNRYEILDAPTFRTRFNSDPTAQVAYEWYDAASDAWRMKINPTPANGVAITYSYYWEPPKRTATTDLVVCPRPIIVARLALAEIYEGEDEDDKKDDDNRQAEQLIGELQALEDAPAIGQLTTMQPIEGAGRPRGIGSY